MKQFKNENWYLTKEELKTIINYAVEGILKDEHATKEDKELIEYIYYSIINGKP